MPYVCMFESGDSLIDGSLLGLRDMIYSYIWSTINEKVIIMHYLKKEYLLHGNLL